MNKKKFYSAFLLLSAIIFVCSFSFAANDNTMMQNAANNIKNVVGGTENAIENAAGDVSNTAKNITSGAETAGNNVGNAIENGINSITQDDRNHSTTNSDNNNMTENITNEDNGANYTANRTAATTTDNTTFLGMNTTTWIWLIMGIAALGIGILIYSYFNQRSHYEHPND